MVTILIFEWDESKRHVSRRKHGIDFGVTQRLFDGRPLWTIPSKRLDEERFLSAGMLAGVFVTVVWTRRQSTIRIISVRRSRHAEKRHYRALYN